jgi:precorrin-6x reductase
MSGAAAIRPGAARVSREQNAEEMRLAREGVEGLRAEGWSDADIKHMAKLDPAADREFERVMATTGRQVAAWRVKANIRALLK